MTPSFHFVSSFNSPEIAGLTKYKGWEVFTIWVSDVSHEDAGAFPNNSQFPGTCGSGTGFSAERYDRDSRPETIRFGNESAGRLGGGPQCIKRENPPHGKFIATEHCNVPTGLY